MTCEACEAETQARHIARGKRSATPGFRHPHHPASAEDANYITPSERLQNSHPIRMQCRGWRCIRGLRYRSPTAKSRRHPAFRGRVLRTPINPNRIPPPGVCDTPTIPRRGCGWEGYKKQIFRHHVGISVINKHVKISKLYPKNVSFNYCCGLFSCFYCLLQIHIANIKIVCFMCNYF